LFLCKGDACSIHAIGFLLIVGRALMIVWLHPLEKLDACFDLLFGNRSREGDTAAESQVGLTMDAALGATLLQTASAVGKKEFDGRAPV